MRVHPDKTAHRAVDACGGTHPEPPDEFGRGWVEGFDYALDRACEAVKKPDALMNDMVKAAAFAVIVNKALDDLAMDGITPSDDYMVGFIPESRGSPSFRLQAGHIRMLAAAIAKATGDS